MKLSSIQCVGVATIAASPVLATAAQYLPKYLDKAAPVEERVQDLLGRMTIDDKMAQMMQGDMSNWVNTTTGAFNLSGLEANMAMKAGSFYVGYPVDWKLLTTAVEYGQNYLLQNTSLKIPALVQSEGIHGFLIQNATVFGSPIAQACTFNPNLIQQMGEVIATEAKTLGVNNLFAPVVNLAREQRFGRVEETYGEDPFLSGEMGYAYVQGLQSKGVLAMVKQYAPYQTTIGGLNAGPTEGGLNQLQNLYLPPFKRAIIEAGAYAVMGSYTAYDGIPATADKYLLTSVLREQWGFEYIMMTDAGASDALCTSWYICEPGDMKTITSLMMNAGDDIEMGGGSFNYQKIPDMVANNQLNENLVDQAVERILRAKFASGLFDNPLMPLDSSEWSSYINTPANAELSRKVDQESLVLLENKDNLLPLKKGEISKIALIGPMGNYVNYGDYVVYGAAYEAKAVNPLQGLQNALENSTTIVEFAQGCQRWSNDKSGFHEAIDLAKDSDVAIVMVGTWTRDQNELWGVCPGGCNATTGEHNDQSDLRLVGAMADLVKAITDTDTPTIVILSSGVPITEAWLTDAADALIQQFYPGEQGGNALADILFGDVNPSGRLAISMSHSVGTLPVYYNYLKGTKYAGTSGQVFENGTLDFGHDYVLDTPFAWYPFGYGISYSNFTWSNVTIDKTNYTATDTIKVSLNVTNTSPNDGQEVVQIYIQDVISSIATPIQELKGFSKVAVSAGQTVTVNIDISIADLALWGINQTWEVESGRFNLYAGKDSANILSQASFWVN